MSIVKRSNHYPTTSLFDEILNRDVFDWTGWSTEGNTIPRANIFETDNDYRVELAVPGYNKEDFQVELNEDTLTIQTTLSEAGDEVNRQNYTRKEFGYHAFRRSFQLPNTVESDQIHATYKDGILGLSIPKKEEAKKSVRTIAVS